MSPISSGESNFFAGEVVEADEQGCRDPHSGRHRAAGAAERQGEQPGRPASGVIAVRPEAISLGAAEGLDYRFTGRVQNKIYLGDQTEFSIATAELGDILVRAANSSRARGGRAGAGGRDHAGLAAEQRAGARRRLTIRQGIEFRRTGQT